jgi:hypothetical protein
MFIQAMELGIIVPLCVLSGLLLLRKAPWGYTLASVGLVKFVTLVIAVSLMGFNMACVSVSVSEVELVIFPGIALANLVMVVVLLKNLNVEVWLLINMIIEWRRWMR